MQEEVLTINSTGTLMEVSGILASEFKEHKYLEIRITAGKQRSIPQNSLIYKLYALAAHRYEGETPATIRQYCKLTMGVPILRSEDEAFRLAWDDNVKRTLTYEQKLAIMDFFPVTSLMNTDQESRYIDAILTQYSLEVKTA